MTIQQASQDPNDPITTPDGVKFYAPNFHRLVVKLDGMLMSIADVVRASARDGYVDIFERDVTGSIVVDDKRKPKTFRKQGNVTIEGSIAGCSGCSKNRRRNTRWWV